ncbi:hypothetical protein [Photobacterium leiognathi]|uniref:hypothetical protein n=1 Tax=Photobacterium leiognathi TaxID=553611 RepID=UPI0027322C3B|nr:hypothetical protein [Photobacterium leiognathi]
MKQVNKSLLATSIVAITALTGCANRVDEQDQFVVSAQSMLKDCGTYTIVNPDSLMFVDTYKDKFKKAISALQSDRGTDCYTYTDNRSNARFLFRFGDNKDSKTYTYQDKEHTYGLVDTGSVSCQSDGYNTTCSPDQSFGITGTYLVNKKATKYNTQLKAMVYDTTINKVVSKVTVQNTNHSGNNINSLINTYMYFTVFNLHKNRDQTWYKTSEIQKIFSDFIDGKITN